MLPTLDALLKKLKRGEKDGVDGARPAHGHAQATVHVALEKSDLDGLDLLALGVHEGVALIDGFGRVDGILDTDMDVSEGDTFSGGSRAEGRGVNLQIKAHETIPHSPPATRTANGLEWVPSPPKVVRSCLLLS